MNAIDRRLVADIFDQTKEIGSRRRHRKQNYGWSFTIALLMAAAAVCYFGFRSMPL